MRGDQIEVFKISNGHENTDPSTFFKIKTGKITRGRDFALVKGQSRLDVRKYYFSQRTVNEWNKLSADCVHSSSVRMSRIDNYLVRAGYSHRLTCGLSISQWLPCLQPSELLVGWQSDQIMLNLVECIATSRF